MSLVRDVVITRVGAQGDGVADGPDGPVYVPFTLASERVRASFATERGRLLEIMEPSVNRIAAVCQHFGRCGGCAVQHMAASVYSEWKRDQVIAAFRARGIDADVAPLLRPEGKRRRAVLTVRRTDEGMQIGFHEAQTHDLFDIRECPVLERRIVEALPGLKRLLMPLISKRGEAKVSVTVSAAGLDVAISGIERALTAPVRAAIAKGADALGLARVSVEGDSICEALMPYLVFGSAEVPVPPGVFIQAMGEAEQAMADLILIGLGKVKTVADLFSGAGAFTFRIASRAKVFAVDSDKSAIAALAQGVRKATGIKPVSTLVRDLFREPLSALELNAHDAVVFDPPRAGAEAQVKMLVKSKVKTVVAVSCNPATLARDARVLIDGGYKMEIVTPIDQFQYSPHIEAVVVFRR
jgi:23S rRNA (uracil1939-C5)-methyltransferase